MRDETWGLPSPASPASLLKSTKVSVSREGRRDGGRGMEEERPHPPAHANSHTHTHAGARAYTHTHPRQVGDELLSVDGIRLKSRPAGGMFFASSLIAGPPGARVLLSFLRRFHVPPSSAERRREFPVALVRVPHALIRPPPPPADLLPPPNLPLDYKPLSPPHAPQPSSPDFLRGPGAAARVPAPPGPSGPGSAVAATAVGGEARVAYDAAAGLHSAAAPEREAAAAGRLGHAAARTAAPRPATAPSRAGAAAATVAGGREAAGGREPVQRRSLMHPITLSSGGGSGGEWDDEEEDRGAGGEPFRSGGRGAGKGAGRRSSYTGVPTRPDSNPRLDALSAPRKVLSLSVSLSLSLSLSLSH